jgi:hypothetical protein
MDRLADHPREHIGLPAHPLALYYRAERVQTNGTVFSRMRASANCCLPSTLSCTMRLHTFLLVCTGSAL